jgi:hypothetical protein
MKKILFFVCLVGLMLFSSCSGCNKQETPVNDTTEVIVGQEGVIDVDHAIATDRQAMYMKFGDNYRWYETCIRLPYFLDSDSVTSNPGILVNIFQSIEEFDNGADTYVWKFQHFPDGTIATDSIHGFWIEDCPLNEGAIKINYKAAFEKMLEVNLPKPHSKNVILRNPVGPVTINAQWIFGNISEQIWVDAVTGKCASSNPAFPKEKGFKMPLGEWP